jgi:predicted dehydrogenase
VEKDESMGRIGQASNFVSAVFDKARAFNTAGEALQLMRIIDAMYKSARTRMPVKM